MNTKNRFFAFPDESSPNIYICLLAVGSYDYICRVSRDPLYFEAESKLAELLHGKEQYLQMELQRSQSIDSFCERILHFISKLAPSNLVNQVQAPASFYRRILDEVRNIGWDYVTKIDPTLEFIEITLTDEFDHKINIRFDLDGASFPRTPPKVTSNLPIPVRFDWDPMSSKLSNIVDLHKNAIQVFQPFWSQLEDLDSQTCVIEPREPSLNCCLRRIVVSNFLQIQIEINPLKPLNVPKIIFFGAEQACKEMRERFMSNSNTNSTVWNYNRSLRENLEAALGVPLKKRDDDAFAETDFECGICYTERLGAELPEIICEKCGKMFHRSCLLDWLRSRPKQEHSFQVVYGTCPFCDAPIQCAIEQPH
ncbi:hypothetical protein M9Y10_000934 [Tritrichomonas musculus]|uniref:RING-type domain-containing protein n=1 Tax=Tritrichomonas musculus TaxID=1915356 RepID=A0ABR2L5M0_9EUKA